MDSPLDRLPAVDLLATPAINAAPTHPAVNLEMRRTLGIAAVAILLLLLWRWSRAYDPVQIEVRATLAAIAAYEQGGPGTAEPLFNRLTERHADPLTDRALRVELFSWLNGPGIKPVELLDRMPPGRQAVERVAWALLEDDQSDAFTRRHADSGAFAKAVITEMERVSANERMLD